MRRPDPHEVDEAFDQVVEACRASLAARFPEAAGYETRVFRLSGALEGTRFEVSRGRFCGQVSTQRYVRSHGSSEASRAPVEIRLVAHPFFAPRPGSLRAPSRRNGWALAGCALGTMTLGTLGLGVAGLISSWMHALVVIPALVAWRTCSTISLARSLSAPPVAALEGTVPTRRQTDAFAADATNRWNRALAPLREQRERLDEARGRAPFREAACARSAAG
jgi:hypothetical protein